jgi:hypothetical protein
MTYQGTIWLWTAHGRLYIRWSGADRTAHEVFMAQFGSLAWNQALRAWSLPVTEARAAMGWAGATFGRVNLHAPRSEVGSARRPA